MTQQRKRGKHLLTNARSIFSTYKTSVIGKYEVNKYIYPSKFVVHWSIKRNKEERKKEKNAGDRKTITTVPKRYTNQN